LDGFSGGIAIGGRRLSNLRYADDIILIAGTEEELQDLVTRLEVASAKFGLMINADKTKVMATGGAACDINVGGTRVEQVDSFSYLGSLITEDSDCTKEIRVRLGKGQGINTSLKKLWSSHNIDIKTKIRLWKTLVWSVATFGCETWTLKKADEDRISAFEMKGLRQILRNTWT